MTEEEARGLVEKAKKRQGDLFLQSPFGGWVVEPVRLEWTGDDWRTNWGGLGGSHLTDEDVVRRLANGQAWFKDKEG